MDKLDKLLEYVIGQEEKYHNYATKALENKNQIAFLVHSAEASVFGRVRWAIEDLRNEKELMKVGGGMRNEKND